MCGIVGAIAQRDVAPILLEGLKRLEYRGYDSAGMAVLDEQQRIGRHRRLGKVAELDDALTEQELLGALGIAHTRWATHGSPSELNAHPHISNDRVAVVHNGIIENHQALRLRLAAQGYPFTSDTDTEVIAHLIDSYLDREGDLQAAVRQAVAELEGAYAIGVLSTREPARLIAARQGSPLVVGVGIREHFIASDIHALLPVTQQFIYLENGDIVALTRDEVAVFDVTGQAVTRPIKTSSMTAAQSDRSGYRHYMLKEIHEQPRAIGETLEGRLLDDGIPSDILGQQAEQLLRQVRAISIVACGTSYHAGLVAKHWFEEKLKLRCDVEVASEFRYRLHPVMPGTLFVTISQSGETADTLAALEEIKRGGEYLASLAICNVAESSLIRESDLALLTHAGPEIGVASTKAFTTQLVALLLLLGILAKRDGNDVLAGQVLEQLRRLPGAIERVLGFDPILERIAGAFVDKHHALFLGRGPLSAIAMEGALKLKEISYIHAEAYPAGELKHGPLALVDADMPVVAVAPNNGLLEKLKSNLEEVRARGGQLYVLADRDGGLDAQGELQLLPMPATDELVAPLVYTIPLQLLAYHVAVLKGTDVDRPRNLAKSVTVE